MADVLVPDMLAERAADAPGGTAMMLDGGQSLTFGDWHARARATAGALRARGVRPRDRVALIAGNADWPDFAVAYFGVLMAGATALPLSARLAAPELTAAVRAAGCAAVLHGGSAAPPVSGWSARFTDLSGEFPDADPGVGPDDLAQLLYTAGTTGTPKLVAASHRNVLAGWTPGSGAPHDPGRFFVHATPVASNSGQVTMLHPLQDPHTAVLMEHFDPARYCDLVEHHRADHTLLVPAMASWLVESGAVKGRDLSSLRSVVLTAAPAGPSLLAAVDGLVPSATIVNCYTSTEAWPAMTAMDYDPSRPGSLGRPLGGRQVEILDEDGKPCPPGETGEIVLSMTGVPSREYLGETSAVFDAGRVRTGDLGHLDEDGYLYLVDRRVDLIVTGGANVSCLEVENTIADHPAVIEAAVAGVAHPVLGTIVGAMVVPRRDLPADELRDWLRTRLAGYKIPAVITRAEGLPRNHMGKIVRGEVRSALEGLGLAGDRAVTAPRNDDERVLLRVWCEVLGRYDLGVEDDFIAAGGHSLAAFRIADLASAALGVPLPRSVLLTTPTVAAQAEAVAAARREGTAGVRSPIRRRPRG